MSTKYTADGQEVHVIREVDGGFIVERLYHAFVNDFECDEIGVEVCGEPIYMDAAELYDKPPKAKIDAEIAELRVKAQQITDEINELRKEKFKADIDLRNAERRPAKIAAMDEQMRDLEAFLEHGISHVVKPCNNKYGTEPRLIAAPDIDRYSQPSFIAFRSDGKKGLWVHAKKGMYTHEWHETYVVPFANLDDAIAEYAEQLKRYMPKLDGGQWRKRGEKHINICLGCRVAANAEWLDKYYAKCAESDAMEAEKKREQLAKLQAELGEQA